MTLLNDTSSMEPSTLPLARVPTPIQESVCCSVLCWVIHQPVSFDEPGCEAHTRQAGVTVSSPHRNLFWGQQVLSAGLQAWPSALTKQGRLRQERSKNQWHTCGSGLFSCPVAYSSLASCTIHHLGAG